MGTTATINAPHCDELVHHAEDAVTAYSHFTPTENVMKDLVDELFTRNWKRIVAGPCILAAVFEICFTQQPEASKRTSRAVLRSFAECAPSRRSGCLSAVAKAARQAATGDSACGIDMANR